MAHGRTDEFERRERMDVVWSRIRRANDVHIYAERLDRRLRSERFREWARTAPPLVAPEDRALFEQLVFGDAARFSPSLDARPGLLDPRDLAVMTVCVPADGTATARRGREAGADRPAFWRLAVARMSGVRWRGRLEVAEGGCRRGPLRLPVVETGWPDAVGVFGYEGRCARLNPLLLAGDAGIDFRRSPACEDHWRTSPGSFRRHLYHELGHQLGFDHVAEPFNIMHPEVGQWDMPDREAALMRAAYASGVAGFSLTDSRVPALGVPVAVE